MAAPTSGAPVVVRTVPTKLPPVLMFSLPVGSNVPSGGSALSSVSLPMDDHNVVDFQVTLTGTGVNFDLTVVQGDSPNGPFLPVPDPAGTVTGITAAFDGRCEVLRGWVAILLSSITGTFGAGEGIQVSVVRAVSGASNVVRISETASQNLAEVGGSSITLGQRVSAGSLPVVVASDQSTVPVVGAVSAGSAITAAGDPVLAAGTDGTYVRILRTSIDGALLIQQDVPGQPITVNEQLGSLLTPSGPASLTANTDTSYTFSQQVHHLLVQNNTTTPVNIEFDATATAGSLLIPAGSGPIGIDVGVTVVHLISAAASNVNGTTAANIVLRGAA